jgi:hypothetical protein
MKANFHYGFLLRTAIACVAHQVRNHLKEERGRVVKSDNGSDFHVLKLDGRQCRFRYKMTLRRK